MPEARQSNSKLADMLARASNFRALVGMAVDVVGLFMALLSFVESSTPSLSAQGEQRRSAFFNIRRDIGPSELAPLILSRDTCLGRPCCQNNASTDRVAFA